jgi:sec-independent protein translocase protein TatA
MLGGIGIQEIVIILIVGLLVFGAARLPKIARSLGLGIKEFKKTVKGLEDDDDDERRDNVKYVPPAQNYGQQYAQYNPQYNPQQNPNYPQGGGGGAPNPQGQFQAGQNPPGNPGQASSGTAPNAAPNMPNTPNTGPVQPDNDNNKGQSPGANANA